jgi:transcription antitermination protein NusB
MSALPTSRSDARERAMELLYEADSKNMPVMSVVATLPIRPDTYVLTLVAGVEEFRERADEFIVQFARDWSIDRMPVIDKIVLRIAIYELLEQPDVPKPVVINEAVELAKTFSMEDSGKFVNGMLTSISDEIGR